ncbi:Acg family FMN-binding oxidoreductase [Actinokineospora sp. HUAS TT18]|uniref:Acg family FMN-binding oxidoreductase n=1 Tax=Actinokineospora sp. HUAS TT18 TaxID=3447451 RepID=UPI003F525BD0
MISHDERTSAFPDAATTRAALELAGRAPSVHNSQPWRWRLGEASVHLYADWSRQLPATDPDGRDLLISCGAALHHLRVAFAAFGWRATIHRLPNPAEPDHLAAVELAPAQPTRPEITAAAAILRRRSDRRPYGGTPVPLDRVATLTKAAGQCGVVLTRPTPATREALGAAISLADAEQERDPGYATEVALWTGRDQAAKDGVPRRNAVAARRYSDVGLRRFSTAGIAVPDQDTGAGLLVVLGTASDDPLSRLRAGEATSAVLLAATGERLSCCPLTQPLEVASARELVRESVLDGAMVPQMIVRVGWPRPSAKPLPSTPRRPVDELID